MTTNQAIKILSNIAGPHVARIIVDAMPNMSRIKLWWIAHQLHRGVPVAKIVHNKWFYGLRFYTNKYTLDPRPDTETLVAAVLDDYARAEHIRIADLGTGTGCIIAAIAKNINATGVAIEKSWRALRVAKKNIRDLELSGRITVQHGDFGDKNALPQNCFDVIVSNPPYIARGDSRVNDGAMFDPKMALYATQDGFAAYEQIANNAKIWIINGGRIYVEIGIGMAENVKQIFTDRGWAFIKSLTDLGEITRVLVFENMN